MTPIITVGSKDVFLAAINVIARARRFAGLFETKTGAITEIKTQPGTLSSTRRRRGLRERFRSAE